MNALIERWRGRGGRAPGPPDYVGVGSWMVGSAWWHSLLLRHPEVEPRSRWRRSLFFFRPFCERPMSDADVAAYQREFWRRPGRLDGEWSQRYMYDHWTPPLLHRAAPDARLLVMLGNPVDRYREKLAIERRLRKPEEVAYYMSEVLARSRYATQLRHLWRYYEPERTLVLQWERCRAEPRMEYARTLRFLGLRDDFDPFAGWRGRTGDATAALEAFVRRKPRPAELWPDLLEELLVELEEEMGALQQQVPDLDLRLWPEFAELAVPRPLATSRG